uniref:hypothetical protein n=1 Tax=Raoultella ornithinolytica TaxID=54291 RepID=UPI001953BEEE
VAPVSGSATGGFEAATRQKNGTVHGNPFINFPVLSDPASNVRQISAAAWHLRCFEVVKFCVVF